MYTVLLYVGHAKFPLLHHALPTGMCQKKESDSVQPASLEWCGILLLFVYFVVYAPDNVYFQKGGTPKTNKMPEEGTPTHTHTHTFSKVALSALPPAYASPVEHAP